MSKKQVIKINESYLKKIVKESVKKVLIENKTTITKHQAGMLLFSYLDNCGLGNRFYEFAQDLCDKAIQEIESKYIIVGSGDGTPYTDEDDEMWYDEYRNDFMTAVFDKIQDGEF